MRSLRSIRHSLSLLIVALVGLLSVRCADAIRITPTTQRVIIQRPTVMYRLKGEQRLQENVGKAFPGDTLLSFATAIAPTEAGDRYLFYIVWGNVEAWFDNETGSQAGKRAISEYEAVTSVCDTKFIMPAENDSTVWQRAFEYVNSHTSDVVQYATSTLIQTSKRNRLPNGISFVVRRTPQGDGSVQYSVRANDSSIDLNARKCSFFMQTGRDERQYYGMENISRK